MPRFGVLAVTNKLSGMRGLLTSSRHYPDDIFYVAMDEEVKDFQSKYSTEGSKASTETHHTAETSTAARDISLSDQRSIIKDPTPLEDGLKSIQAQQRRNVQDMDHLKECVQQNHDETKRELAELKDFVKILLTGLNAINPQPINGQQSQQ